MKKDEQNKVLLITSCITVDDAAKYVVIKNKEERLSAYMDTVEWAVLETGFDRIVICDNSGFVFEKYERWNTIVQQAHELYKSVEALSFRGKRELVVQKGKGAGEGEIVEYALFHSSLLQETQVFYKLTGRLKVQNINHLEISKKPENVFIFDVTNQQIDTRFYKMKRSDYEKYLLKEYENVDDSKDYYLEHVFYKALWEHKVPFRRFCFKPEFRGKSGTTGVTYEENVKRSAIGKMVAKSFLYSTYAGREVIRFIRKCAGIC